MSAEVAETPRDPARERLRLLVDDGSFLEFGSRARHHVHAFGMQAKRPEGDGVVTGTALVDGRPVALFSQDPTSLGGSLGEVHAAKIAETLDRAARGRMPSVGLLDSGGARIQEGVAALDGYGSIFFRNVALSGRVPQVSVVLGPCAGGAVYSPALTDVVIMARDRAHMFVTGPRVVKAVTFEDVSLADLGGADVHGTASGVAHLVADDAPAALELARRVLSYLPSSCDDAPPVTEPGEPLPLPLVPTDFRQPYDVRGVIGGVVDAGSFLELSSAFARNVVLGFARVEGRSVGVVANQPQVPGGVPRHRGVGEGRALRAPVRRVRAAARRAGRRARVPARHRPGGRRHHPQGRQAALRVRGGDGAARHGRAAQGVRRRVHRDEQPLPRCGRGVRVARRGARGDGRRRRDRRDLPARAARPTPASRPALLQRYRDEALRPEVPAERLSVDEIIDPAETRAAVAGTLRSLRGARRPGYRHDNLPQ